jgi:hypothetical protein
VGEKRMNKTVDTLRLNLLEAAMREDDTAFSYDEEIDAFYCTLYTGGIPPGQSLRQAIDEYAKQVKAGRIGPWERGE